MDTISQIINRFREDNKIPGLTAFLVINNKEYWFFSGVSDLSDKESFVSKNTLFEIGSLTKLLTAEMAKEVFKKQGEKLSESIGFLILLLKVLHVKN